MHGIQDFLEVRTGPEAEGDEIVPGDQRGRDDRLFGKLFAALAEENIVGEIGMAARAIDTMQFQLHFEMRSRHETLEPGDAHLAHVLEDHVVGHRLDRGIDIRT